MQKNKVFTYIGFAIRAKKLRTGTNAIKTLKGDVFLLIICKTASKNAFKEVEKLGQKFNCPILITNTVTVEEIVNKENCKIMAICDRELSKAIIASSGEDFREFSGGNI